MKNLLLLFVLAFGLLSFSFVVDVGLSDEVTIVQDVDVGDCLLAVTGGTIFLEDGNSLTLESTDVVLKKEVNASSVYLKDVVGYPKPIPIDYRYLILGTGYTDLHLFVCKGYYYKV